MEKVLQILIVAIGGILILIAYSFLFGGKEFKKLFVTGITTISKQQAKIKANELFSAMASFGTDEKTIFDILKELTKSDLIEIYNSFGLRKYLLGTAAEYFGYEIDLFQWFEAELSTDDYNKIRIMYPNLF